MDIPILSARNIEKKYGSFYALKGVDFNIYKGQVTTLFGENGAGKSTLMKILSGVISPSDGEVMLNNKPVSFKSLSDAQDLGISIIHQELSLAPNLSVRDNIFLGREIKGKFGVNYDKELEIAQLIITELEEDIDPLMKVSDLRLGQQQLVEIARALSLNSKILIMDEPTSALSASEVKVLFKVIRELTKRGVAIVYISHHLEEALEITDNAVVLRDGVITANETRENISLDWVVRHMVGDNFDLGKPPENGQLNKTSLSIKNLTIQARNNEFDIIDDLSLDIKSGEIICIYGLMGSGRTELLEAITGIQKIHSGSITMFDIDITTLSISQRINNGLVLVPEDRQKDGLIHAIDIGKNISLPSISNFSKWLFTSSEKENSLINDTIFSVTVKTDDKTNEVSSLSGGNQQKIVIGKMLATQPKVILLDEPSRGVDIGAKSEIFQLLSERSKKGLSVIYTTSELNECFSIAHRIIIIKKGKIVANLSQEDASKEIIMSASGEVVEDIEQV